MRKICLILFVSFSLLFCCGFLSLPASAGPLFKLKVPYFQWNTDSIPKHPSIFKKIDQNIDSLMKRNYRDSVLRKITKANAPSPPENSEMTKSEVLFQPYSGKIIRNIYYRQLNVFGPGNINDTTFHSKMKLINFANRLHYNTRIWAIRQALFFKPDDTLNAYKLADNERYLRNLPNIEDARIEILRTEGDSVDLEVVTKDIFEYGAEVFRFNTKATGTYVFDKNLFGDAQGVQFGFLWNNNYSPQWNTEAQYNKYNVAGTFTQVSLGYSRLNNTSALDTGVFEGSYYLNITRPLYTTRAKFTGGLSLSKNYSINIYGKDDSLYRDYSYTISDVWAGYNFKNQYKKDGTISKEPNLAVLVRQYNLFFQRRPSQLQFEKDPVYNDRRYGLLQFVIFKQDFFKTNRFFGFGRTEDIPLGYTIIASSGIDQYEGVKRFYTGTQFEKYFPTHHEGLVDFQAGISSFWENGSSEDAVIHLADNYYSRLFKLAPGFFREFFSIDYLNCPNSLFYKPLNINMSNGIFGYQHTTLNGYQRLNIGTETMYYSPVKIYGFKFNFYAQLQASILSTNYTALFRNPLHSGIGIGCLIRNENLPINTLQVGVTYLPNTPAGIHPLLFELTTIADFRFNIYAIQEPEFLPFQ